jgi:hypothetical protein
MAILWTIRCSSSPRGERLFCEWVAAQPAKFRATLNARLSYLAQQPHTAWVRPHADLLHKDCPGITELKVKASMVQYRPLGFFGPRRGEFTFLSGFTKDKNKFPKNECARAQDRRIEVTNAPDKSSYPCYSVDRGLCG